MRHGSINQSYKLVMYLYEKFGIYGILVAIIIIGILIFIRRKLSNAIYESQLLSEKFPSYPFFQHFFTVPDNYLECQSPSIDELVKNFLLSGGKAVIDNYCEYLKNWYNDQVLIIESIEKESIRTVRLELFNAYVNQCEKEGVYKFLLGTSYTEERPNCEPLEHRSVLKAVSYNHYDIMKLWGS